MLGLFLRYQMKVSSRILFVMTKKVMAILREQM